MYPSEVSDTNSEEFIGAYLNFDADDKERILEGESGRPNQGILNVGSGEIQHLSSQYQVTHHQAAAVGPSKGSSQTTTQLDEMKRKVMQKSRACHETESSKKRERIPLDDEERREKKRIADKKSRDKSKAYRKNTEEQLQAAKRKVERLESLNEALNEARNLMVQNLQDGATQIGKLQCEITRLNETVVDQKQKLAAICLNQDHVRKMEEELQGLRTKISGLECMNASLREEKDTMTEDLQRQATNTQELQSQIGILNAFITQQQQFVDLYSNGLNPIQELLMEQEQLGQEENGRLGFEGGGGPISIIETSVSDHIQSMHGEMSKQVENWKREAEEARNDCAEARKQMLEVLAVLRAEKERMPAFMKSLESC